MKHKLVFTLLLAGSMAVASAQTASSPNRELGIRFQGINLGGPNEFSLVYKKQKAENRYRRWRATFANLSLTVVDDDNTNIGFNLGFLTGMEKRRPLADKFTFNHGWEYGPNLGLQTDGESTYLQIGGSVGYVLGVQYQPDNRFFLNLETIPGFGFSLASDDDAVLFATNLGFQSVAAFTFGWSF